MHIQVKVKKKDGHDGATLVVALNPSIGFESAAFDDIFIHSINVKLTNDASSHELGTITPVYLDCQTGTSMLVVGTGDQPLTPSKLTLWLNAVLNALKAQRCTNAILDIEHLQVQNWNKDDVVRQLVLGVRTFFYQYPIFKTQKTNKTPLDLITILVDKKHLKDSENQLQVGEAIAKGMNFTRNLGNCPPNICNPNYLFKEAKDLAKTHKNMRVSALNANQLNHLGAHAFMAVAQGSQQEPLLIQMEYVGHKTAKPIVLVGKGITFDSGGISIKPALAMDEMKYDMCGAAAVMGVMQAIALLELPVHVVGLLACAENMPSGKATRPGDIVTTMSGQSVEILNTDAEGRLVLCDTLTYAQKNFKPKAIIDIATLTGACVVALGSCATGLMGNNADLTQALIDAGKNTHDLAWELPLFEGYQEQLESRFADMANIGGPKAGAITAACFLSRFVQDIPWAHMDIAGTAWLSGKEKGATGRPVPLLVDFLIKQARHKDSSSKKQLSD